MLWGCGHAARMFCPRVRVLGVILHQRGSRPGVLFSALAQGAILLGSLVCVVVVCFCGLDVVSPPRSLWSVPGRGITLPRTGPVDSCDVVRTYNIRVPPLECTRLCLESTRLTPSNDAFDLHMAEPGGCSFYRAAAPVSLEGGGIGASIQGCRRVISRASTHLFKGRTRHFKGGSTPTHRPESYFLEFSWISTHSARPSHGARFPLLCGGPSIPAWMWRHH